MVDYRKLLVALVVAILFTIFVQTSIEAFKEAPEYNNFCENKAYPALANERIDMTAEEAQAYKEDMNKLNEEQRICSEEYQDAREKYNFIVFIVSAILGLIAVVVGLLLSVKDPVGMSIASGLLLGGLLTIFIGAPAEMT